MTPLTHWIRVMASSGQSLLGTLLSLTLLLQAHIALASGERLALVIGNSDYSNGSLTNPVNDATDIAERLRGYGFKVDLLLNADQRKMEKAINGFTRSIQGDGSVGLFYFAGHGIEHEGHNYLVPIGANVEGEVDLKYETVDAGRVLDGMAAAGNGLNLVVLDACRNNPYRSGFRSASRGLARMGAAKGTLILYATQPGAVAQDGDGRNGVFTKHLLEAMSTPGLEVEQVFKRAALAVDRETGGAQTPWVEGVVLGRFAFAQSGDQTTNTQAAPATAPQPVASIPPPPPPIRVETPSGHLQINVNTSAQVMLDGQFVGNVSPETPLNLSSLPIGQHQVAVSSAGYEQEYRTVQVEPGRWTQEVVAMVPRQSSPPAPPPQPMPKSSQQLAVYYPQPYQHIASPGFNCGGKLNPTESIICNDPALGKADGIMGALYRDLRSGLGTADANMLRDEQRTWIKQRNALCPAASTDLDSRERFSQIAQCLRRTTDERIAELWQIYLVVSGR